MNTVPSTFNFIKESMAKECLTFKEYLKELKKFNRSLERFITRIPLIDYVEINPKEYPKDLSLEGYLKIDSKEALLEHIFHRKDKTPCFSFKVVFKDGQKYYTNAEGFSSHTNNCNSVVVDFLIKVL